MPTRSSQQLDELLLRCQRDQLIDAFEKGDGEVIISLGYARHRLSPEMAVRFLEGVLQHAPDLHSVATLFAHVARPGRSAVPAA